MDRDRIEADLAAAGIGVVDVVEDRAGTRILVEYDPGSADRGDRLLGPSAVSLAVPAGYYVERTLRATGSGTLAIVRPL